MSNKVEDDESIILYSEGMSVSDLANLLNVGVGEILKKIMGLDFSWNKTAKEYIEVYNEF